MIWAPCFLVSIKRPPIHVLFGVYIDFARTDMQTQTNLQARFDSSLLLLLFERNQTDAYVVILADSSPSTPLLTLHSHLPLRSGWRFNISPC